MFTIVGCGDSAKNWTPRGHSIGVNDAWKWGQPTDSLLICNRPTQFSPERLDVILSSKPKTFYSHKSNWAYNFPDWKKIPMIPWYGSINPGSVYYSNTSPFIAMSLAYTLGAKDIILWGVDFKNHSLFNDDNPIPTKKEVGIYMELVERLGEKGVSVWLGAKGTAFDDLIQEYA